MCCLLSMTTFTTVADCGDVQCHVWFRRTTGTSFEVAVGMGAKAASASTLQPKASGPRIGSPPPGIKSVTRRIPVPRKSETSVRTRTEPGRLLRVSSRSVPASPKQLVSRQVALGELALSPDGSLLVYTRRTVRGNDYETHLWLVAMTGGGARQRGRGAVNDAGPQFTPDGRRVAFLRDEKVWAIAVDGGEAETLSTLPHGFSAFRLSPEGTRIALVGGAPEPHLAVGGLPD